MSTQISIQLPDNMFQLARRHAKQFGFSTVQDFIRETLREKLFEREEKITGFLTAQASEKALAKHWLTKEEDDAGAYLQKET